MELNLVYLHKITDQMFRKFFILTAWLFCLLVSNAQQYPQNDFIPPLDIPLKLSGTFGELRSNHFHSGMDLKTGELEGLKVYSIADGYISRIKVQSGGYGKALYITHSNGFVSVYAHLSIYNSKLDSYVKETQYNKQSYEVDIYPAADLFPVGQGEIVAYSGNSGRSGGPHLHFEIRDEGTQKPINPLQFNFQVTDNTPPLINLLKVYPLGKSSTVENSHSPRDYYIKRGKRNYVLNGNDTIGVNGTIYCGLNTYDPFNGGMNKNGVYSIRLFVDDELIYSHKLETFSFDETRYINSLIDYKEYKTKSRRVQKSFIEPNNKLSIYTHKNKKGFTVKKGSTHRVTYKVSDIEGNVSELIFWIKDTPPAHEMSNPAAENTNPLFSYAHKNSFKNEEVELQVPGYALYDTLTFVYAKLESPPEAISAVHQLHFDYVALQKWCILSIKPNPGNLALIQKALIVKIQENGKVAARGGRFNDGFIETRVREFGNYCILIDTVPPTIKPVNIRNNKSLLAQNTIRVKITDKLSGIGSYNGYLNNSWILMEYDEKNDLLTYHFDQKLKDGENIFELKVSDERKNKSEYKAILTY